MVYKAGIIGCGRIGSTFDDDPKRKYIATHIGAYKYLKNTDIAAVCDIDKEKLKRATHKWGIKRGYTDYKEMLSKEKIDLLSICTPEESHYLIVKEAVKNKHLRGIFCEKPIADNVRNAQRIIKLCKENRITLQIDHQRRFDPLHMKLKEIINSRRLGQVQQANFYYTAGVKNTGAHMFDLLRFLFGDVEWLEGVFSKNSSRKSNDPNVDGTVKFKNGVFATFQSCDVNKFLLFELNCILEKGRIIVKNSGFSMDFYTSDKSRYYSGYKELYKTKPPFNINYKRNFMVNAIKHILECIRDNEESISSGIDGLAALRLIEDALCSARNNGRRMFLT